MQPENPNVPNMGPENMPMPPAQGVEQVPSLPSIEAQPGVVPNGMERYEQAAEAGARAADIAGAANQVQAPPVQQPTQHVNPTPQAQANPLTAADEDLIEQAWVGKAKEIVQRTKGDPYERAKQVGELKLDYRQKRFGNSMGGAK